MKAPSEKQLAVWGMRTIIGQMSMVMGIMKAASYRLKKPEHITRANTIYDMTKNFRDKLRIESYPNTYRCHPENSFLMQKFNKKTKQWENFNG